MNKAYSTFICFIAALLLVGVTANAGMNRGRAVLSGVAALSAGDNDSTSAAKNDTATIDDVPEESIVDEVIWVVGDEPILKSDVEMMRLQAEQEGMTWHGNPDCAIPEQLALQKLFLHQAAIDSIEVSESEVTSNIDRQIDAWIQYAGSKEKLEEYRKMSVTQMRQQLRDDARNQFLVQRMKEKLVEDVKVTPADVRRYFANLPADSLPFVPTEVEVEIITKQPKISQEEINRVKEDLREYTERVTSGKTSFATLARLYSEDPGSARQGGELGYTGRGMLDPAFANVAFNLTDPKKISKIVESEYGFHIIQLIDKRGDKMKCRHILRKPEVSQASIDAALSRLDSIAEDIRQEKFTFDEGASIISEDKETRNNHGLMSNTLADGDQTTRFEMGQLSSVSTELARVVEGLQTGEVSKPFTMVNSKGRTVCAIARLRSRLKQHRASMAEDFQVLRKVVEEKKSEEIVKEWIREKQRNTYVRINEDWRGCDFLYPGWIK